MPTRSFGESVWAGSGNRVWFRRGRAVVVLNMAEAKRRTPVVVVRGPRTAPLSAEDRRQAVTAVTVMIQQWWSDGRGRSADAFVDRISPAVLRRLAIGELVRMRRRTAVSVMIGP